MERNPLLEWNVDQIWKYIDTYKLPINPLYEYFSRIGCWCCPFKSSTEWKRIEILYPEKIRLLNSHLEKLANRLGIKDKQKFIQEKGWTYWIYPTKRVNIGSNSVCNGGKDFTLVLSIEDSDIIQRITDIIPIITNDFRVIRNRIRISVDKKQKIRLRILIERALNCVGCGACLTHCKEGALSIENGHLVVNQDLCTHCHSCLASGIIKGSCISRHYRPKRISLIQI